MYITKRGPSQTFPPLEWADASGLLCVGGNLKPQSLLDAYGRGIFPWPQPDFTQVWFSPPQRGVLLFKDLHLARRQQQYINGLLRSGCQVRLNTAFREVIQNCQSVPRREGAGTWITDELLEAYCELHKLGHAHSVEAWLDDQLVGGIYGVWNSRVFSAESMFYKRSHAGILCLVSLVEELKKQGLTWMDIQMLTPVTERMGGSWLTRSQFIELMESSPAFALTKPF